MFISLTFPWLSPSRCDYHQCYVGARCLTYLFLEDRRGGSRLPKLAPHAFVILSCIYFDALSTYVHLCKKMFVEPGAPAELPAANDIRRECKRP